MFGLINGALRPQRFDANVDDVSYSVEFARYAISSGFNSQHVDWVNQYYTNLRFFLGDQWIYDEDLEHFLKTTSNQSKNRIKVNFNYIYPIVSQYIGNARTMDITVKASATSTKAVNRREDQLAELLLWNELAESAPTPEIEGQIRDTFGLGRDKKETEQLFNNLWQDKYVKIINAILTDNAEKNDFKNKQGEVGVHVALSGLGVMEYQEYNGEMVWDVTPVDTFFFDHSALKYDLSDAGFMGVCPKMLPSVIYEKYKVSPDDRKAIDNAVTNNASVQSTDVSYCSDGKVPVYKTYWKDSISYEYGYVMDEFNYPIFVRINYKEGNEKEPQYTDKDLIPYKELNETQRRLINGKSKSENNKTTKWVDVIRFCEMIPREVISTATNKTGDIVLDYGIMPYQDTEYYKFATAKFPFKCYCWNYTHGMILTPISLLINPQRQINRFGSVAENLVNCSMPAVPAYDKSMIDPQGGEAELLENWYQGKPLALDARGVGINNAITKVGSTLDTNSLRTYQELATGMQQGMWNISGINESILGQSQGSEQLVGVTALQIQRGSLIQEPYYSAIANIFEQAYKAIGNVGKRIYADNEKELSIAAGDDAVEIVKVTKDMANEDFRIYIHREPNIEQQKLLANQTLDKLIQMGLINNTTYADLYNRSTPTEVAEGIRKNAKEQMLLAQRQAEAEQQTMQQVAMQEQEDKAVDIQQQIEDRNATLASNQMKKETGLGVAATQAEAKLLSEQMRVRNTGKK